MQLFGKNTGHNDDPQPPMPRPRMPEARLPPIAKRPIAEAAATWGQEVLDLQHELEEAHASNRVLSSENNSLCDQLRRLEDELTRVREKADHYQRKSIRFSTRLQDAGDLIMRCLSEADEGDPPVRVSVDDERLGQDSTHFTPQPTTGDDFGDLDRAIKELAGQTPVRTLAPAQSSVPEPRTVPRFDLNPDPKQKEICPTCASPDKQTRFTTDRHMVRPCRDSWHGPIPGAPKS